MTAPTPEQMRALAEREEREAEHYAGGQTFGGVDPAEERYFELLEVAATLRTAADQLEALRSAWDSKRVSVALYGVLHAATREDSDE